MNDIQTQVAIATPPAATTVYATVQGWPWAWLLQIAMLGWVVLQAAYLLRKWWREERAHRAGNTPAGHTREA